MEEEGESLEKFLKWASKIGISDSPSNHPLESSSCLGQSLCVSFFPVSGGRGLAAARDLRKGELILRVPKSALMTRESLMKDEKLSVAVNKHPSLSSTQIFTVCLLYEMSKRKSSWWYPYLMQLPQSYDTLACLGHFETEALQVDDAIWAAEKATSKAECSWVEAIPLMKELNLKSRTHSFRAWLWASATISSRTLHIPWDDAGCLCPVGDLFNYDAPGEDALDSGDSFVTDDPSDWRSASSSLWNGDTTEQYDGEQLDVHLFRLTDGGYEEDVSAYCFYARRNYQKGEQVLLSYGTYTNLELLEHYGFLLDKNPNDKAFIPVEPEVYSSCSWPKDSLYIHQNGKPSFALRSALRLWLTPKNQRRAVGHLIYSGSQLSVENEKIVMGWTVKTCKAVLKNFATSIEEDKLLVREINKIEDFGRSGKLVNVLSTFEGEARAFLENRCMINGESGVKLLEFRVIRRHIDRWKLAVQWRLRYKRILADCITFCTEIINKILSVNGSAMRTNTQ
ncbi:hypothetical protein Vadar_003980 [Vaccinium darrowii]|uniref:Uncharacterized protein n=1 Tax=Vaccinium darrowii TaxID=229202 RepID=A0ACB7YBJ6_9ERIC|nr:hypothetical protein Vadar_003980 [Vaccinium darrowii]